MASNAGGAWQWRWLHERERRQSESGESEQLGTPFLPFVMASRGWLRRTAPRGSHCLRVVGHQGQLKLAIRA